MEGYFMVDKVVIQTTKGGNGIFSKSGTVFLYLGD